MPDPTVTEALGRFVAGSDWRDIPAGLRHEAKRSLLNHIGCALGTAADEFSVLLATADAEMYRMKHGRTAGPALRVHAGHRWGPVLP